MATEVSSRSFNSCWMCSAHVEYSRQWSGDRSIALSGTIASQGNEHPDSGKPFFRGSVHSEKPVTAPWVRVPPGKASTGEKYEQFWRDLFSDPSQWWDNRAEKPNSRFPDFKHKQSGEGLWVDDDQNPPWVAAEIGSLAKGSSIFAWALKLSNFNKAGQFKKSLQFFDKMQEDGINVDGYVFVQVVNACAGLQSLEEGRRIHGQIIETGCELNRYVNSSLVDMYSKCGSIDEARKVFEKMPSRNVVGWTAMIVGCVKCGDGRTALEMFQQMQKERVEPNAVTFVGLLNACASLSVLEEGRRVHEYTIRTGCEMDPYVSSGLVDMYAKCGSIDDAWKVFNKMRSRDVVDWTAMIIGCVKCGKGRKALELFQKMQQAGVEPGLVTFVGAVNACASLMALEEGKRIHEQIIHRGCLSDVYVGSSLVDMYGKCGSIDDARRVFDSMPTRNVVAWNGMILGCVKCGLGQNALDLYKQMQLEGIEADTVTYVGVFNSCASVAALEEGRRFHEQAIQSGHSSYLFVRNSLVDMYAKCGSLEEARRVFDNMQTRDVVSWNAMIRAYAMYGLAQEAAAMFEEMHQSGSDIDDITFVCLLSACSHGGLVKEGVQYFESMKAVYGVTPTLEHYTCMVDILGRAGRLEDAQEMIKTMPFESSAATWLSLLGACRIHGNVEMGERASKRVLELDPRNVAGYVLLSNIYGAAGQWDSKALVHDKRLRKGVLKEPGRTWIEVNNEVHSFVVKDSQHPQISEIQDELERLSELMKKDGYVPDTTWVLHDVEDEMKVAHLGHHSEKLAIAFGLISTPAGTPLRIVKNLRVCGDCHTAFKFISRIVGRTLVIRDVNRFHHFKDGHCSCRDFW